MLHPRSDPTRRRPMKRRPMPTLLGIGIAAAIVTGACTSGGGSSNTSAGSAGTETGTIPQPVVADLSTAPEDARVDLAMPSFTNPTDITNPLFPVSSQESVLMLGRVDGLPFRTEVTLLPDTRIIEWGGQQVETLVSQYTAFLDGRIHEVAFDFYAQADDGSVWYFGEDVLNFKDGLIADTHGTWIAGKDGPAAMIMPADPQVGDIYRPENIPGFVFEEVTVKSVDQSLQGPLGPIDGGLVIEELHMDGKTEAKTFAPGYGEFFTAGGGDVEALSLAVPTDSLAGPTPEELVTLETGATDTFEAAASKDWQAATVTVREMAATWKSHSAGDVPRMIAAQMGRALDALTGAVDGRDPERARQAAIDVAQWSLDLQLLYRPAADVDLARFSLWAAQLQVDAAADDPAAVNGDLFTLDYIRDRIAHVLNGADVIRVNTQLEALQGAVGDEDLVAAAHAATRLRETLAGIGAPSA